MAKKATETKSTKPIVVKKATVKVIKVNFQKPGEMPTELKVKAGTTVKDIVNDLNIDGYTISLNGGVVSSTSEVVLTANDILRIGHKTKNAN